MFCEIVFSEGITIRVFCTLNVAEKKLSGSGVIFKVSDTSSVKEQIPH